MDETNAAAVSERQLANAEKRRVALISVLAAVFLTAGKLVVGLTTGSLGILSEAAHSGLDLAAAALTVAAVWVAGLPADKEHTYGHGKAENVSAFVEILLLLLTSVWIVHEAVARLFFETKVQVEATKWSFIVIGASLLVDFTRSRALMRVAKKYKSQALEADALHFATDVWSSLVVLGGLALVSLSKYWETPWLAKADSVAALGVAAIVVWIGIRMGREAVAELTDAVPSDVQERITQAAKVPGVLDTQRVRVRRSGPETFIDVTLLMKREEAFETAHEIATQAEEAIRAHLPGSDVVVHLEPVGAGGESLLGTVRVLAARHGLGAHHISISEQAGTRSLAMHLEVSDELTVEEAHQKSNAFEKELRQALPDMERITTHLEPVGMRTATQKTSPADELEVLDTLRSVAEFNNPAYRLHSCEVRRVGDTPSLSLHCEVASDMNIATAHALATQVEQALRRRLPQLGRVVIHVEPKETH
jgi:cation diffusion facilitator family transporter